MSVESVREAVCGILADGVSRRIFPGGVVEFGRAAGAIDSTAVGRLTYAHDSPAVNAHSTVYDLASLTKVLATTALVAGETSSGRMRLNDRVRHWIPAWTGEERQVVTLRDLLEHASGLPAHRHYYKTRQGRASFEMAMCEEPLDYPPRTQSIYSDPGFMLLGFAIETAAQAPLDTQFRAWRDRELTSAVDIQYGVRCV